MPPALDHSDDPRACLSGSQHAAAAVALNRRGVELKAKGDLDGAIDCYREAATFAPHCAAIWSNLGNSLLARHRAEEAVDALRRAVDLEPRDVRFRVYLATGLNTRGIELKAGGQVAEAVQHYREALTLAPDQSAIWSNLGNALTAIGQQAISQDGTQAVPGNRSRIVSKEIQLLEEAVECHRRALAIDPDRLVLRGNLAIALNALGVAYRRRGMARKAVACHREAVSLTPEHAWSWANLGNALKDIKHLESAIECHRRAIALDPTVPALVSNLGITLAMANRSVEAVACFDEVLARQPNDANTRWDRGLSLLRMGDFARGWPDYEARFDTGKLPNRNPPGRRWRGEPYPGQTLLLLSEQGFGDAIWTARYLRRVKAFGGTLILEARKELIPLMEAQGFADRIIPKGAPLPTADWHAHVCSLPGIFTPIAAEISGEPYLKVPSGYGREALAKINAVRDRLRVGIVWSGSTTFKANHERRASLGAFIDAFTLPGVQLFSLQKGPPEQELKARLNAPIIDLAPILKNFADTATAVSALDLIIMTDSAVAHLAGAVGTPIWLITNFVSYWLWHAGGANSRWYQTLRCFNTAAWNDWIIPFDRASTALMELTKRRLVATARHS